MKPLLKIGAAGLLFAVVAGCTGHSASDNAQSQQPEPSDYTTEALAWADSVVGKMTIEEKVGQLFMPAVYSRSDAVSMEAVRNYVEDIHVGGFVLLKGTSAEARVLSDSVLRWSRVTPLIGMDAEWGLGMRFSDSPSYPVNRNLRDVDAVRMFDYGREIARQARISGVNLILGPVADVVPPDGGGFIGMRSFGSDTGRVADMTVAYSRGLESGAVMSCAKHFPGHGSASGDSHKSLSVIRKSREALLREDMEPFRRYAGEGLSGIMVGHLSAPSLDSTGRGSSYSEIIIQDYLRGELEFQGLVLTDALSMGGASGGDALDALKAGADIVLCPADTRAEITRVIESVRSGDFPESDLDARVRRILFYKYRFRLG